MKYNILEENQPINLIEVSYHEKVPKSFQNKSLKTIESKKIITKIFTDGFVSKVGKTTEKSIGSYMINDKKYPSSVDTLSVKEIYLQDYSYVVVYTIAKEWMTIGKITGYFDTVKNISIYLSNPKDKTALKKAKQTINFIDKKNKNIDYSSVKSILAANVSYGYYELYDKQENNVYTLKKYRND